MPAVTVYGSQQCRSLKMVGCPRRGSTSRRYVKEAEELVCSKPPPSGGEIHNFVSERDCMRCMAGSLVTSALLVGQALGPPFSLIKWSPTLLVGRASWAPSVGCLLALLSWVGLLPLPPFLSSACPRLLVGGLVCSRIKFSTFWFP